MSSPRKRKATKRAKPKVKRVRCKYRKGEVLEHHTFGFVTVESTKKVGPRSFNVEISYYTDRNARIERRMTVSERHLLTKAKRVA